MTTTVTFQTFCDSFPDSYMSNFTYQGKRALFDYLEQLEEDTGEQIEMDIIALCSEYTEYADLKEVQDNYEDIKSLEDLQDHTTVIEFDSGLIIQDF
jgi:hypothetical protein